LSSIQILSIQPSVGKASPGNVKRKIVRRKKAVAATRLVVLVIKYFFAIIKRKEEKERVFPFGRQQLLA
jgi:hypothetical protein